MIFKNSTISGILSRKFILKAISTAFMASAFIPALIPADVAAQTCRVSMGVNSEGHKTYMEVYEYDYVAEKPCFPGGDGKLMEYINKNRNYPREAYKAGVQGRVTCSFIVNANGSVSHVRVIKSVEESLNREAARLFTAMPDWEPGKIDGKAVPVRVIWSVPFRK